MYQNKPTGKKSCVCVYGCVYRYNKYLKKRPDFYQRTKRPINKTVHLIFFFF